MKINTDHNYSVFLSPGTEGSGINEGREPSVDNDDVSVLRSDRQQSEALLTDPLGIDAFPTIQNPRHYSLDGEGLARLSEKFRSFMIAMEKDPSDQAVIQEMNVAFSGHHIHSFGNITNSFGLRQLIDRDQLVDSTKSAFDKLVENCNQIQKLSERFIKQISENSETLVSLEAIRALAEETIPLLENIQKTNLGLETEQKNYLQYLKTGLNQSADYLKYWHHDLENFGKDSELKNTNIKNFMAEFLAPYNLRTRDGILTETGTDAKRISDYVEGIELNLEQIPDDLKLKLSRPALNTLLSNMLNNAIEHMVYRDCKGKIPLNMSYDSDNNSLFITLSNPGEIKVGAKPLASSEEAQAILKPGIRWDEGKTTIAGCKFVSGQGLAHCVEICNNAGGSFQIVRTANPVTFVANIIAIKDIAG